MLEAVNPLRFVVDAFVNTFGITRPTPEQEASAGRFIALMLVLVVVGLGVVAWVLRKALVHSINGRIRLANTAIRVHRTELAIRSRPVVSFAPNMLQRGLARARRHELSGPVQYSDGAFL